MSSGDFSQRECFSGYLSSSLDVPNVALNPFCYLWGKISQGFFRSLCQAVCVVVVAVLCVCVLVDASESLMLNTHLSCLDSAFAWWSYWLCVCVCCCLVVFSQQCFGLLCVCQVHVGKLMLSHLQH
ncbi:hypothetical protein XENOCAPTIV_018841 [Xenoophorus captivus]|uniref:Uncharacterized protein n=1 Tax=Xenoophorus captivus TaxID=1517983 RepID=A0ABV0QC73_9TELE